jgi:histidyl-tRNA synthetase
MARNFKSVSQFVNAMNIPFMIFLGPKEMDSGLLTLKNFQTQEQFENVSVAEIIPIVKQQIEAKKE